MRVCVCACVTSCLFVSRCIIIQMIALNCNKLRQHCVIILESYLDSEQYGNNNNNNNNNNNI
jgi:hypothetical protein